MLCLLFLSYEVANVTLQDVYSSVKEFPSWSLISSPRAHVYDRPLPQSGSMCTCRDETDDRSSQHKAGRKELPITSFPLNSSTLSCHLKRYIPLSRFWGTVLYSDHKYEFTLTAAQCDDSNSSTRFLPCLRQKFSLVFPLSPHRMSSERTGQRQKQEVEPGWLALN
jgi:hypothetical protein